MNIFLAALVVSQAALADNVPPADVVPSGGYQTCTLEANRIVNQGGKERVADPAYAKVCLAVLPPTCRNWVMNKQPCAYRQCVVDLQLSKCPNGDITAYVAKNVIPFTEADFAAMNANISAAVPALVARWGANAPRASGQAWQTQINHRNVEAGNGNAGGVTYNGH